jgi:hypothetical protein
MTSESAVAQSGTARGRMKLEVGQQVFIDGGFGPEEAIISDIVPPCVYVDSAQHGRLRFNSRGDECLPDGTPVIPQVAYPRGVMAGPGPFRLLSAECQSALDKISAAIGKVWGPGKITQQMWEDHTRQYAVRILQDLIQEIKYSDQKFSL